MTVDTFSMAIGRLAFFEHALRGASADLLREVDAPTSVYVNAYRSAADLFCPIPI